MKQSERLARRGRQRVALNVLLHAYDPVREVACKEVGVPYVRRRVSSIQDDATAIRDVGNNALPTTWDMEPGGSGAGKGLVPAGVKIFDGQAKANGSPSRPATWAL